MNKTFAKTCIECGAYTADNIQLVCVAVNRLRVDMSTEEFINWCHLVSENNQGVQP